MLQKTRGVVLGYIKYGETSIIARVYTEEMGLSSFIVNSIRSQKSKKSIGYFQPFTLLDMVVYIKNTRGLQRISEFKSYHPLHRIHADPVRSAVTIFLTEVFSKLIQVEQEPSPSLYRFMESSVQSLDQITVGLPYFHLQFLLKLAAYLGYEIEQIEVLYSSVDKLSPNFEGHGFLEEMIRDDYGSTYDISKEKRNDLLSAILDFYGHHANIQKPKSLEILRSILS